MVGKYILDQLDRVNLRGEEGSAAVTKHRRFATLITPPLWWVAVEIGQSAECRRGR
jgi:hypothetical protein